MSIATSDEKRRIDDLLKSLSTLETRYQTAAIPENDLPFADTDKIARAAGELGRIRESLVVLVDDDLFMASNVGQRRFTRARELLDLCVRENSVYEQLLTIYDRKLTADNILHDFTGDFAPVSDFLEVEDTNDDTISTRSRRSWTEPDLHVSRRSRSPSPTGTPSVTGTIPGRADQRHHFVYQWAKPGGFNKVLSADHGSATVLTIGHEWIVVGTSRGIVLCFDMGSQLRAVLQVPESAFERHPVTALAVSAEGKAIACGFRDGGIAIWDMPAGKLVRALPPTQPNAKPSSTPNHPKNSAILHLTFLNGVLEFLSADERGLVLVHTLSRMPVLISDKRVKVHGSLPESGRHSVPTTIFAMAAAGQTKGDLWTEEFGVFAISTPYKMAIMALRPELMVHYKLVWSQEERSRGPTTPRKIVDDETSTASSPAPTDSVDSDPVFSCMAWAPLPETTTGKPPAATRSRILACSRGRTLHLVRVNLTGSKSQAKQEPSFEASILGSRKLKATVVGLWFLDSRHILLLDSSQYLSVVDSHTLEEIESGDVSGLRFLSHDSFGSVLAAMSAERNVAYYQTVVPHRGKLLGLTPDGLILGGFIPWRTRINRLLAESLPREALAFAKRLLDQPDAVHLFAASGDQHASGPHVAGFAVQKMVKFVRERLALHRDQRMERGPIEPSIPELISLAVESSLELNRPDALVNDFFELFSEANLTDGFLDSLHPHILEDCLANTQLETSFLNALTSSYVSRALYRRLEEELVHLDAGLVNVDTVVSVCRKQRLWRALVNVYNRQLRDYITPLIDLLRLVETRTISTDSLDERTALSRIEATDEECYLLYVYLTYVFTGKAFPRGIPEGHHSLTAKSDCWNFLLAGHYVAWPPMHMQGPVVGLNRTIRIGKEPLPYLATILKYDGTACFGMLASAFEDVSLSGELWIRPLTDGRAEAVDAVPFGEGAEITRQSILDILFHLLLPQYAEGSVPRPRNLPSSGDVGADRFTEAVRMMFVCFTLRSLRRYSTFIAYDDHTIRLLLRIACASSDTETFALREACAAEMIRWQLDEASHTDRWLGSTQRDFESNMEMFERAGFFKAAELLARKWGRLDRVVDCYVLDPQRRHEAMQGLSALLLEAGKTGSQQRPQIVARIVAHGPSLAASDPAGTARLIESCAPDSHLTILGKLADRAIQYQYLSGLLGPPNFGQRAGLPPTSQLYETYIDLMCIYDEGAVLRYLQDLSSVFSERPYSLAKVLESCKSHDAVLPASWLLEASGDAFGALRLVSTAMQKTFNGCFESFTHIRQLTKGKSSYEEAIAFAEIYGNSEMERAKSKFEHLCSAITTQLKGALAVCQRSSRRLSVADRQQLWFTLLELLMEQRQRLSGLPDGGHSELADLRGLFRNLLTLALNGMVGHISLPLVLEKIVREHSDASIGEYRDILVAFMSMYNYEQSLLETSKRLVADDLFQGEGLLLRNLKQGHRLIPGQQQGAR